MIKRVFVLLLISSAVVSFFVFRLDQYLTLEKLKAYYSVFDSYYHTNRLFVLSVFFLAYIVITAASLPGAAVMTLFAGALFGLIFGTVIVSFASAIGATLAFLSSRVIIGDYIQNKYGDQLKKINSGIEKDGWVYLMTLRLTPVFPFFVVNLLMGLTKMSVVQYYIVSQIAMLPGTVVFVYAGQTLSELNSVQDILSPNVLIAFFVLAVFPFITRLIVNKFITNK